MKKWKLINENSKYEASTDGEIRRIKGVVAFGKQKRKIGGKIMSPSVKSNGYLHVSLRDTTNQPKMYYVHRLVCEAFLGEIPKGMCVNHIDGVKSNNKLSNLEIVTYSENTRHAIRNGLIGNPNPRKGVDNHLSTFTEEQVLEMRRLYDEGMPSLDVAKKFNRSKSTVRKILYRTTWKHV